MADAIQVQPPAAGWVTLVYCDHETGAVGQIPLRVDQLPRDVLASLDDGLDYAIRCRAATLLGLDDPEAVSIERARKVVAHG